MAKGWQVVKILNSGLVSELREWINVTFAYHISNSHIHWWLVLYENVRDHRMLYILNIGYECDISVGVKAAAIYTDHKS